MGKIILLISIVLISIHSPPCFSKTKANILEEKTLTLITSQVVNLDSNTGSAEMFDVLTIRVVYLKQSSMLAHLAKFSIANLTPMPTVEGLETGEKVSLIVLTKVKLINPIPTGEGLEIKKVVFPSSFFC